MGVFEKNRTNIAFGVVKNSIQAYKKQKENKYNLIFGEPLFWLNKKTKLIENIKKRGELFKN